MGLDTLALLLLPSYAVHAGWVRPSWTQALRAPVEAWHVLPLFIGVVIIGSLVGLHARTMFRAFPRLGVLLLGSSALAIIAGATVAALLGREVREAWLLVIAPAMGGGVSSGALPLAMGYQAASGQTDVLARLLPAVVLANVVAMAVAVIAGTLAARGSAPGPDVTVLGRAVPPTSSNVAAPGSALLRDVGLALAILLLLSVLADQLARRAHVSEPLVLIAVGTLLMATGIVPPGVRRGIGIVYRFSIRILIVPLLIVVGSLYLPWDTLIDGFSLDNLLIVGATVMTLAASGAWLARRMRLDAGEGALLALARAAMGGSGDITILNASRRMDLMPFALLSTRLGGSLTVLIALMTL